MTKIYFVITILLAILSAPVFYASSTTALTFGSGTYGTCTFNTCAIGLSSSGAVSLAVQPTTGSVVTIARDTVIVETGASTGYSLQIESAAASTTLVGPGAITATNGTVASPQSLAVNTWGYRIDAVGGFGLGPTAAVTNAASSSLTFAGLTAQGAPTTLVTTSTEAPTPGDTVTVWYGARVDTSIPSGVYSRVVMYTAVTN